ncbi:DNA methyltransferase [Bacillus phage BC-VP]|nr:DNA methyltransferase [Bacillus phage BC-VP]
MDELRVVEAFAGIGTQSMALKKLNIDYKVVAISEIDPHAIQSYEAIHGKVNNLGDVSKIDIKKVPDHDLFTYSFPCTDVSVAGKREGLGEGTRSGHLYDCKQIIQTKKPKYLMLENVKNLTGKKFKEEFDNWLSWLEGQGYKNYWKVINAKDYVPQNRERVFVVSILGDQEFNFPVPHKSKTKIKKYVVPQLVKVRKHAVDVDDMKVVLQAAKKSSKLTLKQIADKLEVKKTTVEHWFRSDDCFSIPEADVWLKLKELIGVTTTKFDAGVTEFEIREGVFEKSNRIYDVQGLAPTLTVASANEKILVYEDRKSDKDANCIENILEPLVATEYYVNSYSEETLNDVMLQAGVHENVSIREITPLESWRLMGIPDEYFHRAKGSGVSDSQLYQQAGNAIVVDVMVDIFKELFKDRIKGETH